MTDKKKIARDLTLSELYTIACTEVHMSPIRNVNAAIMTHNLVLSADRPGPEDWASLCMVIKVRLRYMYIV